ncbi:MAG: hypothetical protein HQL55_13610 [Magnetococcales bacterium]|nr:hypothetical protein [Magnetococcales bacterium]
MKIIWLFLSLVCLDLVVTGCGYKGELYLPGQQEPTPNRSRSSSSTNR